MPKPIAWLGNVAYALADRAKLYRLADLISVPLERWDNHYRDEPPSFVWRIYGDQASK